MNSKDDAKRVEKLVKAVGGNTKTDEDDLDDQ